MDFKFFNSTYQIYQNTYPKKKKMINLLVIEYEFEKNRFLFYVMRQNLKQKKINLFKLNIIHMTYQLCYKLSAFS